MRRRCALGSSLAGILVLGYDGTKMRRDVRHAMMVAFWTSVPLFAVSLVALWPQHRPLPLPVAILWLVVMASSAFLTVRGFALVPKEDERGETLRASEWLVYQSALFLACFPFAFPLFP